MEGVLVSFLPVLREKPYSWLLFMLLMNKDFPQYIIVTDCELNTE